MWHFFFVLHWLWHVCLRPVLLVAHLHVNLIDQYAELWMVAKFNPRVFLGKFISDISIHVYDATQCLHVRSVQEFESQLVMDEWKNSDMEHSSSKISTLSIATSVNNYSGLEVQAFSISRAKEQSIADSCIIGVETTWSRKKMCGCCFLYEPVPDESCGTSHVVTKQARGQKTLTLLLWRIPSIARVWNLFC